MTTIRSLNPLDRAFLAGESRESMMHVGSLLLFSPPPDGGEDLYLQLRQELKRDSPVFEPWDLKLSHPDFLASPAQSWIKDDAFELDYHVRRSALPSPGDERELGILVSRLHSHQLDFHRPPWEAHLIEGLEGGRFAIYFKVHHALIDGFTGMRLLTHSLSTDPDDRKTPMFYARPPLPKTPSTVEHEPVFEALLHTMREQVGTAKDVGRALLNVARASREKDSHLIAPLQAPRSLLNQKIGRNRRFATQQLQVERLKRVAANCKGTLNDVLLAVTSASLRRFLLEQKALPEETLTTMLPVNVRPKDDPGGGNAVGAILASLATDVADPAARLNAIVTSTTRAKEQLQGMSKNAIMQFGALLMTPLMLSVVPSAVSLVRPAFNVVVSNVPGPENSLYFRGFRLEANYPLSIPFHGYALNVTAAGYAGTINLGFIGCRDALPHLQRLAVYSGEALTELEIALGLV